MQDFSGNGNYRGLRKEVGFMKYYIYVNKQSGDFTDDVREALRWFAKGFDVIIEEW